MVSTAGAIARRKWRLKSGPAQLRRALGFAVLGLLVFLAIVFVSRRLAGGFVQPLSGPALIAAAAAIAALAPATWVTLGRASKRFVLIAATIAPVALLAALTTADSAPAAVAIAWFTLIVGEAASWHVARRRPPRTIHHALKSEREATASDAEDEVPENVLQQLSRLREADGGESLHALAVAEIAAGDRQAVLHLAFCPPLESPPELTAHALDADDADVRITTAETYGARLEVRVASPAAEPRRVLVEVLGRASH
jgi:hypothetical protein